MSENTADADDATGARSVIDETEQLDPDDPNVASGQGDYNHEDHIGNPVMDEETEEIARLAADGGGW